MRRACVFVDGENFRHSLKTLFQREKYSYGKSDYLPQADWHVFFTMIAGKFGCELLRTYWYVVEQVDYRPYKVPHSWAEKQRTLARWYPDRIQACTTDIERREVLKAIESELAAARAGMESRSRGWREVQASIEHHNDQLEFRRSGSIAYELATKQFGTEKGVDTQLTSDMITLAGIYDAAIILSGDADYLPPVAAVKSKGKLVYSVSFLDEKGHQLPGGARRLSNAVDSRLDLGFEAVRLALNISMAGLPSEACAA